MADSDDGEYVADMSDDEFADHQVTSSKSNRASKRGGTKKSKKDKAQAWEQVKRSWDDVVEDQDGQLELAPYLDAEKRKRLLKDTTPLQRGIIRHLMLVVDMGFAMAEKDMLPTRYRLAMSYAKEFVREYFEQNPISQLGIVGMRDGVAVTVSQMGGNPAEHLERLEKLRTEQEPSGNPSLQNALEMCRGALFNTPSHGTREVVIIYGALLSADPGDIHDTIAALIQDHVRVSIIGLAAQVAICAELCRKTNSGDGSHYSVARDDVHFEELLLRKTTPPATNRSREQNNTSSLLQMGFPSRTLAPNGSVSYCVCHNKPIREGYNCTRCSARVCRLPVDCPCCGLTLILSTHLARSYHHLMPLKNFVEVAWKDISSPSCYACHVPFPTKEKEREREAVEVKGVSESGRYKCTACGSHFCIDCDVFCHATIHNCPGCEANPRAKPAAREANGEQINGAMVID